MSTIQLKECGKVLISSDHRLVVWECFHCNAIHTEWQRFLEHVKAKHRDQEPRYERLKLNEDLKPEECNKNDKIINYNKSDMYLKMEQCNKNDHILDYNKIETTVELGVEANSKQNKQSTDLSVENVDYMTTKNKETLSFEDLSENQSDICKEDNSFDAEYLNYEEESMESEENYDQQLNLETGFHVLEEQVTVDQFSDNVKIDDCNDFNINEIEESIQDSNAKHGNLEIEATPNCSEEFFELATESSVFSFIKMIEQHPCLWKTQLNTPMNEQNRIKSLREMQNLLQLSTKNIMDTLNYLITWFKSEYNRFKDCRSNDTPFTSKYPKYFVKCKFLNAAVAEDFPCKRRKKCTTVSNDFKCSHCEKVFSKKKYLAVHTRRHIKDFSYKCDFCEKRTVNSTDMKTHMRVHTGEKPYVCEVCGKSFKTCSVLNAHIRKHDVPKFQCRLCSKSYFNSTDLKNHTNAHLNKRDYKCQFCTKAFTSAKLVYSHIMNSHSTLRKTFCKICQKCFTNIEYHIKSVHEIVAVNQEI